MRDAHSPWSSNSRMVLKLVSARLLSSPCTCCRTPAITASGRARRSHRHRCARAVVLSHRQVRQRLRVFADIVYHRVADHAHYFAQLRLAEEMETLAHSVLPRPELLRHGLIRDRHQGRVFTVRIREFPSADQRDSQGLEVVRHHIVELRQRPAIA